MFRNLSLRARLSLLLGGVTVTGLALGVGLLILHAGARVSAEAEGATRLARELVVATLPRLEKAPEPKAEIDELLADVRRLRHVRITIAGDAAPPARERRAPEWFSALVFRAPASAHIASSLGAVDIAADPADEIAEIWQEIVWLAVGAAGVAALAFALVSYAVSRTLEPIGGLSEALARIERGDYATRAPAVGSPELVVIAERINSLAATLSRLDAENRQLVRRMIHVQDQERRDIARDLHDEIGPFLFTVRAGVGALARKLAAPAAKPEALAVECARIDAQVAALQEVNRRILGRLRPAALEEMGLADALEALARGWRETRPDITLDLALDGAHDPMDEATALTAYRVAQEGLTNAFRHSGARRISLRTMRRDGRLCVEVADDGAGIGPPTGGGLGMRGMRERVEAQGGALIATSGPCGGVRLVAELPISSD